MHTYLWVICWQHYEIYANLDDLGVVLKNEIRVCVFFLTDFAVVKMAGQRHVPDQLGVVHDISKKS